ncbi:MAG: galactose mutarotase [Lentisphaeria bacterium]|nr:galactose mutarotase [Lentisphaeria bacterium]
MTGEKFFTLPDKREAKLFKLRLPDGFGADITNFGGCVVSLYTRDVQGNLRDVVLGWKNPEVYLDNPRYLGTLVGRVPNRISGGRFTFDGKIYQLFLNDNNICSLHGGFGYSHRLWEVENATASELTLTLKSPDGDAGYPGNLFVRAAYRLLPNHTLELEISAESDRPTAADFTTHTYFNLDGENAGNCAGHSITAKADFITETDKYLQPTGKLIDVTGTPYDLRNGRKFRDILQDLPEGFDNNFVLSHADHNYQENAVIVTGSDSKIKLAVHTSRPGVQIYMGYCLDHEINGKSCYEHNSGFCLETQAWPDAVNHPDFPSIRVEPGKPHHSITRYEFSIEK